MAARQFNLQALRACAVNLLRPLSFINRASCSTLTSKTNTTTADLFTVVPKESLQLKSKPRLAGRKYLPGSTAGDFPEFLASATEFPHAVQAAKPSLLSTKDWARECRNFIEEKLFDKEAILFRSLPLHETTDFSEFAGSLGYKLMEYVGGSGNRSQADENARTYNASDDPPEFSIEPHNELSYTSMFPLKVFFFCLKAPNEGCGGETPLVQNRKLMSLLDPEVARKLEKKKIKYWRYSPSEGQGTYMPWQHCFGTNERKEAERHLEELGYEYSWDKAGGLSYRFVMPAFIEHPISGEKLLFNQVNSHHSSFFKMSPVMKGLSKLPCHMCAGHTTYGDGDEIEASVLQHIRAVTWACAVGFQWQQGDLLVMDNLLTQHARLAFSGERKLLVTMSMD